MSDKTTMTLEQRGAELVQADIEGRIVVLPRTTVPTGRGYYLNSLKAWRVDLYKQLRQEMARYNRMEGSFHPDRPDMGRLCDLTKEIIERLTREIEGVESSNG